jgi:hypothetical protein
MRTLLLMAAATMALASLSPAGQAQDIQSQSGTIESRPVKTESFRRPDSGQSAGQSTGQASTDSRETETTAGQQHVGQPTVIRRTPQVHRARVAERRRLRRAPTRPLRTRALVTTGQATGPVSRNPLRVRTGRPYLQATYLAPAPAVPGERMVLTEPQLAELNAAFADYIVRMNVWSRPVWEFPAVVGATVPAWIQAYGVPAEIVAIDPALSGDEFLVLGDDIVIVDPGTRRIVAMISRVNGTAVAALPAVAPPLVTPIVAPPVLTPVVVPAPVITALASPPVTTAMAPSPEERVRLTRAQIVSIRTVLLDPACRYERPADFFIGGPAPPTAPLCAFPERVVATVPDIADYRYMTRRNAVVVIDPVTDRVVTLLR